MGILLNIRAIDRIYMDSFEFILTRDKSVHAILHCRGKQADRNEVLQIDARHTLSRGSMTVTKRGNTVSMA